MHLKRVFWIVFVLSLAQHGFSYDKMTLMDDGLKNGGFIGASLKMSQLGDVWFAMTGFRMAWVINEHFYFGGAYYDLEKKLTHFELYVPDIAQPPGAKRHLVQTNYAGAELGYIFAPQNVVFLSVYNLMGIGHLQYVEPDYFVASLDDRFVFTEPAIDVNLNLSNNVKFIASAGYRMVSGIRASGMSNKDLSGITLTASLIVGYF